MNRAADWAALIDAAPEIPLPEAATPILVVAAHPDDETLGVGGLLALAADRGHPITVVVVTDGEASHPRSPTHGVEDMRRIRRDEFRAAIAVLAPAATTALLGVPDGMVGDHLSEIAEAIRPHLEDGRPWVFVTWRRDGHPDHEAAALAVARAAADRDDVTVWHYPIWAWHWADPAATDLDGERLRRIPVGAGSQGRRAAALRAYRSQTQPLSNRPGDEAVVSPGVLAGVDRPYEVVVAADPAAMDLDYFTAKYETSDDPWGIGSRWYETRKRALILACLPRLRFAAAFEPGCAAGHLTVELAGRCDTVLAADASPRGVALTRRAATGLPGVRVEQLRIPQDWPAERFDLIVLSEVGYYVAEPASLAARLTSSLTDDGVVLLCHWRRRAPSHPVTAEAVHDAVRRLPALRVIAHHEEQDFLIDVFNRTGTSVALADGILD